MINGKRVLAIIPARGGSKGLPRKNIRSLSGKPLIAWTIEKALKSTFLDEVMVTTDSQEIASIAEQYGAVVPFLRPAELASDTASSFETVSHTLDFYKEVRNIEFDYIVLLEPTSPLREDEDIDRMLGLLEHNSGFYDSIISVGEVVEHPSIIKRLQGDEISPFFPDLTQANRRQDNEPAYFPFGVAYIVKLPSLLAEKTFYTRRCMGYLIKRYQHYEIDDIYDLVCVEAVMNHEWKIT